MIPAMNSGRAEHRFIENSIDYAGIGKSAAQMSVNRITRVSRMLPFPPRSP